MLCQAKLPLDFWAEAVAEQFTFKIEVQQQY